MEGQGPEHSSGRLERFLELSDDECGLPGGNRGETIEQIMTRQLFEINWIVCNITMPSNMMHALRRQILMPFRKPLVGLNLYPRFAASLFPFLSFFFFSQNDEYECHISS